MSLSPPKNYLIDMDGVFRERAWLILETESPELPLAHPPRLTNAAIYQGQTAGDIIEAFQSSRRQTLSLLRGLTSAAWHRTGHHETLGTVPLTHQGNWVVSHERSHLIELAQIRHDLLTGNGAEGWLPPQLVPEMLEGE